MGGKYDDYDWDELPAAVQQAATVLGFTEKIWDDEGETAASEKAWDELNQVEQAAARTLGYNQSTWDEEEEDEAY